MSYSWVAEPEPSDDLAAELGLDVDHPDQGQAEAWLSSSYDELAAAGIQAVSLYETDRLVYGPMSLSD